MTFVSRRIIKIEELCFAEEAYNSFMIGANRGITVAIAVYRFCLIFFPYSYVEPLKMRVLEWKMFGTMFAYGAINLIIYVFNPDHFRRFKVCMGQEEQYLYNFDDFYEKEFAAPMNNFPLSSPFRLIL